MKTSRRFITLLSFSLGIVRMTLAHPVAQGSLDIQILPDKVRVQARVSSEEVLVANAFVATDKPKATELSDVWQRHGRYLLQHLKIFADERRLTGVVVSVSELKPDWVFYQLEFMGSSRPARLRIEEDVLNEIEFAPGNPWEATYVSRIGQQNRSAQEGLLLSRRQPLVFECNWQSLAPSEAAVTLDRGRMTRQYIRYGIGHILGGYDHLLFVCALVLGAVSFWDLIKVVTAFTLAHTLTLTLSVLNLVRLPSHIVEPMIAGSIVFVALTNLLWPKHSRGWVRFGTAFFFGLFHGLGFAGGLLSAMESMNGQVVGLSITAFSIGVELGHQMVVLPLFFGLRLFQATQTDETAHARFALRAMRAGSLIIFLAGTLYLIAALR